MKPLSAFLAEPVVLALGWTLLHFLWQGALVAVLVACARGLLRGRSPALRYWVGCIALFGMLILPIATFLSLYEPGQAKDGNPPAASPPHLALASASLSSPVQTAAWANDLDWQQQATQILQPAMPWLVAAWLLGVLFLSARLAGGWSVALRLCKRQTRPVDAYWQSVLDRLRHRLRISRPVLLLESACVAVPTVVGSLRPVILLPISTLCGLSPEQLEMILAHELGHIRRHDFLVNLLQSMLETVLFYHPAVWWISAWIREEREHCCDDLAITLCGDPLRYAHALTDLEAWRGAAPAMAVAATGGVLLNRIRRLLGVPTPEAYPSSWPLAGTLVLLTLSLAAGGSSLLAKPEGQLPVQPGPAIPAGPWVQLQEGGRILKFTTDQPIQIKGLGKLKIDTKQHQVEFPEGTVVRVGGRRLDGSCRPRANEVLRAADDRGQSFLDISLGPPTAAKTESNVLGMMSLELDQPSLLSLQFVQPYGADFRSQPARSDAILGIVMDSAPENQGLLITALPPDMPAQKAGLRTGDIIAAIDGQPATSLRLNAELFRRSPGQQLPLTILRNGQRLPLSVRLGDRAVQGTALDAFSKAYEQSQKKP